MGELTGQSARDRIQLGGRDSDPRRVLAGTWSGWLYTHERDEAREVARAGTDDECRAFLAELEDRCTHRLALWRMAQ